VTENTIESVTVTAQNETPAIAGPAIEQIPAAIVANQSLVVDTVAGATVTS
jgi:fumarate reductase flavoprotein subunit